MKHPFTSIKFYENNSLKPDFSGGKHENNEYIDEVFDYDEKK
jgi:hypothetical protein